MAISKEEKSRFKFWFDLIETEDNFKSIVYELYVDYGYSYTKVKSIIRHNYRDINISKIIEILKEFDVKRCGRGEDCKSPDGCVQSRDNFADHKHSNDGKNSICKYCKNFNQNFKYTNSIKQNYMLEFQKIKEKDKQDEFLINLYKKGYDYRELSGISLRSTKYIINLLEKTDIKKCPKCGIIQSRSNFVKNINSVDKLNNQCQTCKNEYNLENKEHKSEYDKTYYSINADKRSKYHKNYRTQFGKHDAFAPQLKSFEEVRRDPNNSELIQVRCKYNGCNKWFNPTNLQIKDRINAINGNYSIGTECNFYCSQECKDSCSLYNMTASELMLYDKLKNSTLTKIEFNRMQQEIRACLISIRDPNHCEHCGKSFDQKDLILHHITPVVNVHIFEADLDNLIFVCQNCHKKLHQKDGCRLGQLREYSMENKLC